MKISNGISVAGPAPVAAGSAPAVVAAAPEVDRASAAESAVLKPAREALAGLSDDIDQARVAELREALARGEIRFDAGRLASLIQRFHGGQR